MSGCMFKGNFFSHIFKKYGVAEKSKIRKLTKTEQMNCSWFKSLLLKGWSESYADSLCDLCLLKFAT